MPDNTYSNKKPFISLHQARSIAKEIPTPFHVYDEAGIRENAMQLKEAFSWNAGFKEFFAVKATPNPFILDILKMYLLTFSSKSSIILISI